MLLFLFLNLAIRATCCVLHLLWIPLDLVIPHLSTRCPQSFSAGHLHTCPSFPQRITPVLCYLFKSLSLYIYQALLPSTLSTCCVPIILNCFWMVFYTFTSLFSFWAVRHCFSIHLLANHKPVDHLKKDSTSSASVSAFGSCCLLSAHVTVTDVSAT